MNISDELIFRAFLADRSDLRIDGEVGFVRFEEDASHGKTIYGFNSRMLFGRIVYSKDGHHFSTESLAIKQTPTVFFDKKHCQLQLVNEIYFYAKLLPFFDLTVHPKVDSFFPKFFYSFSRNTPTDEHTAMIFENLRDQGFMEHQRPNSILLDYNHASLVLRNLGHFHGYSLAASKLNPIQFQHLVHFLPRIQERHLIGHLTLSQATLDYAIQLFASRNQRYAAKLAPLEKISQNMWENLKNVNTGTKLEVVCHGDLLNTNLLFKYEEGVPVDVRVLDVGLWRMASPVLDLAHILYVGTDQQTRDQHWDDLMAEYYRGMVEIAGVDEIPVMEAIVEDFKKYGWYEIMLGAHTIRDQQARFENSTRFFDVFGGVNLRTDDISTEEIRKKLEENEIGGATATEMIFNIIKDMMARNFI